MGRIDLERREIQIGEAWYLLDSGREPPVASSWASVREALTALHLRVSPTNTIVNVLGPSGESLSIGVAGAGDGDNPGLDRALASIEYIPADFGPPTLIVVGDPDLTFERGGVVVFRFEGQWTEILKRNCVPVETMIRVVDDFRSAGHLPSWIDWEEA